MTPRLKQLKKLGDKQFFEDIKKYIKSSHSFYESKIPELKVLAGRLHEEYSLTEFYKVFNKFWSSGVTKESILAIYALHLYKEEFNINTWKFIKQKINNVKSWDKIDAISINIVGEILIKVPELESEILNFSIGKNHILKRMAVMSTIPLVRKKDYRLALKIVEIHLYERAEYMQKAIGIVLREIGEQKPDLLRRFIIKKLDMPMVTFFYATEKIKELRRLRESGDKNKRLEKLFFWKG